MKNRTGLVVVVVVVVVVMVVAVKVVCKVKKFFFFVVTIPRTNRSKASDFKDTLPLKLKGHPSHT